MDKIGLNTMVFLLVSDTGKILYSSDEFRLIGLSVSNILDIIKHNRPLEDYEYELERIRHNSEEIYVIKITCKDMRKLYYLDTLTDLYNRNIWEWVKKNGMKKHEGNINTLAIIDIDNLKNINDTYGHAEGDKCIKLVADSIMSCIRDDDYAFRFGGDEFIILFFKTEKCQTEKIMERIQNTVNDKSKEMKINISISHGMAEFSSTIKLDQAFRIADKDMYREKHKKEVI